MPEFFHRESHAMHGGLRQICNICGGAALVPLVDLPSVPALCNQLLLDPEAACSVDRARVALAGCSDCGHVFNTAFDPQRVIYGISYGNSLMGSPRYRAYTQALVDRLMDAHRLRCGTVVEIGCGAGEFLDLLLEGGAASAVGFDPARADEPEEQTDRLRVIGAKFDPALAPEADLVCSRHVLEHLSDPGAVLGQIRNAYDRAPPKLVFLEVPDGRYTLESLGVWDIIYEHVSYFTADSLHHLLRRTGFEIERMESTFGGQYLIAEAHFAAPVRLPSINAAARFMMFSQQFQQALLAWGEWLAEALRAQHSVALWGAGSKGISFLNLLDRETPRAVSRVVDINPGKTGSFVAGTGHPVVDPDALRAAPPDYILLMNPEYADEVEDILRTSGLTPTLVPVSGHLPPAPQALRLLS
jgi:SAM-dependent methyltransferase